MPSEAAELPRPRIPAMTLLACAACIGVFIGLALESNTDSWEALSKWGYLPTDRIRAGQYWALISSVFVHLALWHVAFNVYWLFLLGGCLERAIGPVRWLGLFTVSAIVSSGWELAVSDSTGIGASGVVYSIFGFMLVTRRQFPGFAKHLDHRTIVWFIAWLVGCIALTAMRVWEVGNSAHVSGFIFGVLVGAWSALPKWRNLLRVAAAALIVSAIVPLFWAPWSADWTSKRAYDAHAKGEYRDAIILYERAMRRGQDKAWCLGNLALVYHELNDDQQFARAMQELRYIDPKAAVEVSKQIGASANRLFK